MKDQLSVKDNQISSLTKLTNNAQTLNLVDKDPKRLQSAQGMLRQAMRSQVRMKKQIVQQKDQRKNIGGSFNNIVTM